jgi:hypothetical protein
LSGYISAKLSTSQYLQKFKIFKPQSPIVINRREEVRISDVVDIQEAIDKAKSRVSLIALNKDGVMTVVGNAINLTSDGYFLTSKTIFSDPKTVYNVILTNGRAAPIEQIIIDPASSVAIVKTRLTDVSVAEITGAKELAVGRKVVLIKSSTVPFSADALTSIITSPEQESFGVVFSSTPKTRVIFILHSTPFRASPATPMQWERVQVFPDWSKQREKTICDRPDLLVKYSYTLEGPWSQLQAAICERARDDDAVAKAAIAFRSSKRAADKTRDFMERYDTSHHLGEHPIDGPAPGAWYLRSYLTDSQIAKIAHKMRAQRGEWK